MAEGRFVAPNHGAQGEAKHTGRGIWGGKLCRPRLYRACIERGGRPGCLFGRRERASFEIGQLGIVRRMTSTVLAWHYSKLLRVRAGGSIIAERSSTKSIVRIHCSHTAQGYFGHSSRSR